MVLETKVFQAANGEDLVIIATLFLTDPPMLPTD